MVDRNSGVDNATDRRIDSERLERALTEDTTIVPTMPRQFEVVHDDHTHAVDIEIGSCTCEDHQFRGHETVCKHVLAACVFGVFAGSVRTRLQARVVAATRELGCPHDHPSITRGADCAGPLGRGTFPCPDCINGATPGEWSAWVTLMDLRGGEDGPDPDADVPEPVVATDGGESLAPEVEDARRRTELDPQVEDDDRACEWCDDAAPFAGARELHVVTHESVDADALCTTCILGDAGGEFADTRDEEVRG